jgi:nitrogen-specific signal transduction histidine kinase
VCLERGTPQRFRVTPRFFEILGVEAPPVTDGILLPWRTDEVRGTIFVMAHDRAMAFDADDCELMEMLASFAAMAVRHSHQQQQIVDQATSSAAVSMANHLAHEINNPLQSLTNQVYLALEGRHEGDARMLAEELSDDLNRLSMLVKRLLELPIESTRTER